MAITYTPTTNFGAKDSLPTNDPDKVIKGSEFTTEFTAIQTAFSLAASVASPTFTGTVTIPTADINGGNIDGTIIGAATPAAGSFTTGQFGTSLNVDGTVTADGLTVDNSGTAISITNGDGLTQLGKFSGEATDGFVIEGKANNNLTLRTKANTAGEGIKFQDSAGDNMMFIDGTTGDISFYEDTGTTAKLFWDASAEALGIGTPSPTSRMTVKATGSSFADASFVLENYNTTDRTYLAHTGGKFYLSNDGSTTHMLVDASGNVGIGTSTPATALDVDGTVTADGLTVDTDTGITLKDGADTRTANLFLDGGAFQQHVTGSADIHFYSTDSKTLRMAITGNTGDISFYEDTGTTAKLFWDASAESLSIGSTRGLVHIGTGDIEDNGNTIDFNGARPLSFSVGGSEKARITSAGNVGIGTDSPSTQLHVNEASTNEAAFTLSNNDGTYRIGANNDFGLHFADSFKFANQADTTEYVRIDSSGVVYAGKSAQDISVVGHELHPTGFVFHTRNDAEVLYLRRNSSDGAIQNFYRDSTLVGSIGAFGGSLFVSGANSGVFFNGNGMEPTSGGSTRVDGTENIGASAYRFKDLYLSGSVKVPAASKGIEYSSTAFITPENNVTGAEISTPGAFVVKTGATPAERMRLDSSGTLYVGATGSHLISKLNVVQPSNNIAGYIYASASTGYTSTVFIAQGNQSTTNESYTIADFINSNASGRCKIYDSGDVDNTNGAYGSLSDVKLKTDIADAGSQWDDIKAIRFRKYKMIADPEQRVQMGVIAQELEEAGMSGLVRETADKDIEGNDLGTTTKSVKYSILYTKAVKALQEAMDRIETLEAEVAALKGA